MDYKIKVQKEAETVKNKKKSVLTSVLKYQRVQKRS